MKSTTTKQTVSGSRWVELILTEQNDSFSHLILKTNGNQMAFVSVDSVKTLFKAVKEMEEYLKNNYPAFRE